MTFSKETLEATMTNLNEVTAVRMIALAGGLHEFTRLVKGLERNFNATIPVTTWTTIAAASKKFNAVNRHPMVSYLHN